MKNKIILKTTKMGKVSNIYYGKINEENFKLVQTGNALRKMKDNEELYYEDYATNLGIVRKFYPSWTQSGSLLRIG